ncbi:MAG: hypothetical protein K8F92_16355 [Hyphomicrobium sp.]|uniref:hypothetical protein n=1 Tax=Hyphomicrobium sp. TaxID=82 RepID=UPI00132C09E7|nr:hypothetical protein [Hyphomicrobium sp.]KAB2942953.1 MAG: hypothetical protein F9K20_05690 [Hyphomicrobium sp.]MBZ0211204.1 hypothetical protein [Hyphomicrobium sp.]
MERRVNGRSPAATDSSDHAILSQLRRLGHAELDRRTDELAIAGGTPEERLELLQRLARGYGEVIALGVVDRSEVGNLLREAAVACGLVSDLGEDAVQKTTAAGIEAGERDALDERAQRVEGAPIDLEDARMGQRDALLSVCDEIELWRSPEGETFATITVGDHVEHHSINGRALCDWLIGQVARRYRSKGRPASVGGTAIRDARMGLEARAHLSGKVRRAPLRVAGHDGSIYIDRGTPDWSVIRASPAGWDEVPSAPVPMIRSRRIAPLPDLPRRGSFDGLLRLLDRIHRDDLILLIAWCLGALMPDGPYPVLIIGGEAGAGKSTVVRLLQRVVDPVAGDLLQPPRDDRDLIAAARHGRVLAFDNLSSLRADMADSLCRLSTGSEIGGRALYSDYDTATFAACRPIILNGIPDLAARGDLADRSIMVTLDPPSRRLTEAAWRAAAEAVLPEALAALLDALAVGLRRLGEVETPNVRMADFARLVVAAEPALPWPPGAFLEAYAANRARATVALVDGDLVASTLRSFVRDHGGYWQGTAAELYAALGERVPLEAKRSGDWPGNARWFADRLKRAAPALRALGWQIGERRTSRGSVITIGG